MSKLFNTILIQIALLCYNQCYSIEKSLNLSDFTYENLLKYNEIDNNGSIYRVDNSGSKIYPIYEGCKCYDFQTKVKSIKQHCETLSNMDSGGNLVVKTLTDEYNKTYFVSNVNNIPNARMEKFLSVSIPSNTNIIIPEGVVVTQNDVTFYTVGNNVNLFILGDLNNYSNYDYENAFFYFGTKNCNVFVGPKATVSFDNINHDSLFRIGDKSLSSSIVLYPGCTLNPSSVLQNIDRESSIINDQCILYLNKYTKKDDVNDSNNERHLIKLRGTIAPMVNIIYSTYLANNLSELKDEYKLENINNNGISFSKNNYFPGLYWKIGAGEHTISNDNTKLAGNYSFENSFPPISFVVNNSGKQVLNVHPDNKFAKYDLQLLDDCLVESGKYSFKKFVNISSNENKYINVDTIENLFMNGKTYVTTNKCRKGLLKNMPSDIYPGLIGNKDIVLNYTNNSTCTLHGNTIDYEGKLLFSPGISKIVFKHETYTQIISKQKFNYTFVNNGILESKQEQFGKDITTIIVKNTQYDANSNHEQFSDMFCDDENEPFIDYRDEVSNINDYNTGEITWNLSNNNNANGNNVNKFEECFKDGVKYKPYGSNKIGLINNIPIDILNDEIKANLSGDVPITIYSNNKGKNITFSGNNTKYTGVVSLPSNIKNVYFIGTDSAVKINTSFSKYTSTNNNILQFCNKNEISLYYNNGIETKLINESTNIKLSNVIATMKDNRDTIQNINKYNISGITWNIDTIEDCFIDGEGLLKNFPGTIKTNIIGTKDIIINSNETNINLLGSNSGYSGNIIIPEDATNIYKSERFSTDNIINEQNIPIYIKLDSITELNDNIIELDITGNDWKSEKLELNNITNDNPCKLTVKGDNNCFDEMVVNITNNNTINLSEESGIRKIEIGKLNLNYNNTKNSN